MNEQEIQDLFAFLRLSGYDPKLCDTFVPDYDVKVPCGKPQKVYENNGDGLFLPGNVVRNHATFRMGAIGDSMEDAGISSGDELTIEACPVVSDGDIVLASIDDEATTKAYFEDEKGDKWLVPFNEHYDAIRLTADMNPRIIGKVTEVVRSRPKVSFRECQKIIRRTQSKSVTSRALTAAQVAMAVTKVAPMVLAGRQWYAVYRKLVDLCWLVKDDYEGFCRQIAAAVPQHKHLPKEIEMQRMAVMSFDKAVVLWDEDNAPVKGKRFRDYLAIANKLGELLRD